MKMTKLVSTVCLSAALATGCADMSSTQKRTLTGAGVGAAGGYAIGSASGQHGAGAAIGAAAGAAGGWLYDSHKKRKGE